MTDAPFKREQLVNQPAIVGAKWWHEGLVVAGRREAIRNVAIATAGIAGVSAVIGLAVYSCTRSSIPDVNFQTAKSLEMQMTYGWDFGASSEPLTFNGESTEAFDRERVSKLADELAPLGSRYQPFYVSTLFRSIDAVPKSRLDGDGPFVPLKEALRPILTLSMTSAYAAGRTFAALAGASPRVVIVDLPGMDAVAFAAGASSAFDPIFLFDNWPHPRGVVRSHLTLAAAAYYQPLFAKRASDSSTNKAMPPMFVLDRERLAQYTDEASQFDNRYVARMPTLAGMQSGGKKISLVVADAGDPELDDLNDDLVNATGQGIAITKVAANRLSPVQGDAGTQTGLSQAEAPYTPIPRRTNFSSGQSGGTRPLPTSFGLVPVAIVGGAILGHRYARNGSWNRAYGAAGGG